MMNLQKLCVDELMKQTNPSLEIVSLAERYSLPQLLEKSIKGCADEVPPDELESSQKYSVDWKAMDSSLLKIYR